MTTYRQRLDAGVYKQGAAPAAVATEQQLEPDEQQPGTDAFVCDICGRSFDGEHGLKIHRTKAHGATNGDTES